MNGSLDIGITCTLADEVAMRPGWAPDAPDALAEYDSRSTVTAIQRALEGAGHRARFLGDGPPLIAAISRERPSLVFNIAEGVGGRGRETHVPALLEMLEIPYTHSDPVALALSHDKGIAKRIVRSFGLRTPEFAVIERLEDLSSLKMDFPLMAKPLNEGSSMGINADGRVTDRAALERVVRRLLDVYREPVLIEEFCPGQECSVAILGTGSNARVLGTSTITPRTVANEQFVYSRALKELKEWREHVEIACPPRCEPEVQRSVETLALASYRAIGCRDVGRVDVRIDARGEASFIELNPLPGIAPGYSDLCIIASGMGLDYDTVINTIVDLARARYGI